MPALDAHQGRHDAVAGLETASTGFTTSGRSPKHPDRAESWWIRQARPTYTEASKPANRERS
jgi:hypothetical protein